MAVNNKFVPIITFENERLKFDENVARKTFENPTYSRQGKVILISIVGRPRTGKSFLVTFLSEENFSEKLTGDFRVGIERYTVGIHISTNPIEIRDKNGDKCFVFFLDTQGTFDTKTSRMISESILAFSLLVSDLQILNAKGNFDGLDLTNLQRATEIVAACPGHRRAMKLLVVVRDAPKRDSPDEFLSNLWKNNTNIKLTARLKELYPNDGIQCFLTPPPPRAIERASFAVQAKDFEEDNGVFLSKVKDLKSEIDQQVLRLKPQRRDSVYWKQVIDYLESNAPKFSSSVELITSAHAAELTREFTAIIDQSFKEITQLKLDETRKILEKTILEKVDNAFKSKNDQKIKEETLSTLKDYLKKKFTEKSEEFQWQKLAREQEQQLREGKTKIDKINDYQMAVNHSKQFKGNSKIEVELLKYLKERTRSTLVLPYLRENLDSQKQVFRVYLKAELELERIKKSHQNVTVEREKEHAKKILNEVIAFCGNLSKEIRDSYEAEHTFDAIFEERFNHWEKLHKPKEEANQKKMSVKGVKEKSKQKPVAGSENEPKKLSINGESSSPRSLGKAIGAVFQKVNRLGGGGSFGRSQTSPDTRPNVRHLNYQADQFDLNQSLNNTSNNSAVPSVQPSGGFSPNSQKMDRPAVSTKPQTQGQRTNSESSQLIKTPPKTQKQDQNTSGSISELSFYKKWKEQNGKTVSGNDLPVDNEDYDVDENLRRIIKMINVKLTDEEVGQWVKFIKIAVSVNDQKAFQALNKKRTK